MVTKRNRHAYVMLVVISVSVLMITLLSALANLSLRRGLEAADAERSLQQRWGAITLERALLSQAPKLFETREALAAEQDPGQPAEPFLRTAITLRDVTFDVLLGDEDAKLNLNALYHQSGEVDAARAAMEIIGPGAGRALKLLPAVKPIAMDQASLGQNNRDQGGDEDAEQEIGLPLAFRSWGEVFDLRTLSETSGGPAALPNLTTGMTCWGNGQLNFRRASDEAILAVAGTVVQDGGAQRLLTRYRSSPTTTLAVLLQSEVASQRERDLLARLLSETSSNFSIWLDASTRGGRSLRRFTVQFRDAEGDTRYSRFVD